MRMHTKRNKIQDALELLNDAAQDKKHEVYEMIGDKYEFLREMFEETVHNGQSAAEHVQKRLAKGFHSEEKKIRDAAGQLGKKIKQDPWKVLGGVALGSLVVGLFLARRK